MMHAVQKVLERLLSEWGYRRVPLICGTAWAPHEFPADWPRDGDVCLAIWRLSPSWPTAAAEGTTYRVVACTYCAGDHLGPYWVYEETAGPSLTSAEAAACEAVELALERRLPVCLGTATILPSEDGSDVAKEEASHV